VDKRFEKNINRVKHLGSRKYLSVEYEHLKILHKILIIIVTFCNFSVTISMSIKDIDDTSPSKKFVNLTGILIMNVN